MKYTKEALEDAVKSSISISQVLRILGVRQMGSSHAHISKRIKDLGIDTSHFKGKAWSKDQHTGKKKLANEILVQKECRRARTYQLVRAMLESGIKHICEQCKIEPFYNGKPLTLQVDHINGDWKDNRLENLRFICPNCHSQTTTFGIKNKKQTS